MAKTPDYRIRHLMEEELLGTAPKAKAESKAAAPAPLTTRTAGATTKKGK